MRVTLKALITLLSLIGTFLIGIPSAVNHSISINGSIKEWFVVGIEKMVGRLTQFQMAQPGVSRTVIIGSVYPNQYSCKIPGQAFDPRSSENNCNHPESYAETASQGFSITVMPYIYQFERLKGYILGGIFVSGATGSQALKTPAHQWLHPKERR